MVRILTVTGTMMLLAVCTPWTALGQGGGESAAQPRTLPELVMAFLYSFAGFLTEDEYALYISRTPDEIEELDPELYRKISQNVTTWTNDWIRATSQHLDTVPEKRLEQARDDVKQVDTVLVHESIHYNKSGRGYGHPLTEGITEMAAEYLVLELGLLPGARQKGEHYYPEEQRVVAVILGEIEARAAIDRGAALDLLLRAYLTGDRTRPGEIFGAAAWERVIELSRTPDWSKKTVLKALAAEP